MAHFTYSRSAMSELNGHHHQDRKLMHDTTTARHNDQPPLSQDTAPGSNHHTEGRGDGQSATEETANEDDEEDSSTVPDGEQDDEDDEADVLAPSQGLGKGKGRGKHPAIRVEPVDEESQDDDNEAAFNGTGLIPSKHPVSQLLKNNKKRTFSNLSSTSVLFGDDSTDHEFPRRKMARKLSNVVTKPLLTYKEEDDDDLHENAIESDDEDYSALNLIPDDDSDMDIMEQQEESYIQQEEQQATTLLNEYRDARRLSLESCVSDNIFDVTAPLDEAYISGLPDFGFAQFFEPDALPASPDPAAKRKYSDSSTKRVRFDDEVKVSDSSDSESSELDSSVFPDLFLEQDKLPPILHQLLEYDNDDEDGDFASPQSDASFWDFGQDEHRITQTEDDQADNDSSGSSGYDSDMGDTTDEEDLGPDAPPRTPMQNRSVLRQPPSAPGSRAATPRPFERNSRPTGRQIPPPRGIFIHEDSTKAIAVTNRATKNVTFYRPRTTLIPWMPINGYHSSTSSTANNSPRNSIVQPNANASDSEEVFNNAYGTDIMLTGIFGSAPGNEFFFGNESIGPPEAFYPFVSIGNNGNMNPMDDDEYDDSEDFEDDLNITDFMNFGSEGDDTDVEQDYEETDVPATPATSQVALNGSTPAQPTPMTQQHATTRKRSTSDAMLQHFDRGVVTAFRNNQNRYRDVASLPQDPAARNAVSRPVRSGKSAEALITPIRKRSRSNRMTRTPLHTNSAVGNHGSPLSGVTKATSRLQNSMMSTPRRAPPRMGTFS
ncbi:hypothetical protein CC86DRAFT_193921 [Ophiobolus disseminans]|uniref:Uncharacterized protein n=1 Tax=Ophiobolus disseminans TaxID=1469910 RepID=A0A6A7A5Q9_9PLEO|nr:hypothetical protein CC86DRAFT_193921 [Ophiobolus disseminans]